MNAVAKIARAYDAPSWWYDVRGFFILTFAYRSTLGSQLRLFGDNVGADHLEAAVGSGTLLDWVLRRNRWLGRRAGRVLAFDYAPRMLEGAVRRFRAEPSIEIVRADVAHLPYCDDSFDTANIANAVHCFPEVDAALDEVARVLRPGGTLALNALLAPRGGAIARALAARINAWGMHKGILFAPIDRAALRASLLRAGLAVEKETIAGNTLEIVARKLRREGALAPAES
jgi:ubiquinone/menaquinone biosynthesis C-methylase UbiE